MKEAILLVDDDPDDLTWLQWALEPLDLDVDTAGDGAQALGRLAARTYALIVMDLLMPAMNGFEAAQLIREREKTRVTPILFLSGFDEAQARLLPGYVPLEAQFLRKPVSPEDVRAKVRERLGVTASAPSSRPPGSRAT